MSRLVEEFLKETKTLREATDCPYNKNGKLKAVSGIILSALRELGEGEHPREELEELIYQDGLWKYTFGTNNPMRCMRELGWITNSKRGFWGLGDVPEEFRDQIDEYDEFRKDPTKRSSVHSMLIRKSKY